MTSFCLQNADPDVRVDMETFLSKVVPEVRHVQLPVVPVLFVTMMPACMEKPVTARIGDPCTSHGDL